MIVSRQVPVVEQISLDAIALDLRGLELVMKEIPTTFRKYGFDFRLLVRERIAELQKQTAEGCGMERIDYAKSLVAIYQSPPSAASMDNPLCDVVHTKSGPRPVFPSKISVGSELANFATGIRRLLNSEAGDSSSFVP